MIYPFLYLIYLSYLLIKKFFSKIEMKKIKTIKESKTNE